MKDIPILMNAAMVLAVLDGRKTQTRRLVKSSYGSGDIVFVASKGKNNWWPFASDDGESTSLNNGTEKPLKCPYGEPGDRLWVRETFHSFEDSSTGEIHTVYRATDGYECTWTPSIHMPRRASRLTLEVVAVRVERLKDISAEDATKEGIQFFYTDDEEDTYYAIERNKTPCAETPQAVFAMLWDSIYGSWNADPWVWVIEFKKI